VAKEVIQKATEWSERFIDKGGVECLIKLIMNSDFNDCTQGNLVKQCISLRIELLAVFLKQRPTLLNADDGVGALVKKLIMFLQIVILGNDDDESAVADDGNSLLCEEERPVLKRIRSASTGSLEPPTTNSSSSSVQKLEKKRTRRARFEKYFVSQLKDTSAGENSFEINVPVGADDESECSEIIQDVDALLVDNVMAVLRIIYYEQPTVLTNVILDKQCHSLWEDILFVSLLQSPSSSLRESMSSGVLSLCGCESCDQTLKVPNDDGEVPQLSQFFFGHLLLLLPHSSLEMVNCAEYFKLLSDLVGEPRAFTFRDIWRMNDIVLDEGEFPALAVVPSLSDQRLASQFHVNVPLLFETLVDMVFDHNVHEKSEEDDDIYFQGLLLAFKSFLTAIVCSKNNDLQQDVLKSFMVNLGVTQHLIEELFHNCLFSNHYVSVGHFERVHQDVSGKIRYPKCKSAGSRKNAFDLLNILSTESSNFDLMLQLSRSHHLIDADGKEADDYCEKSLLKYSHAVSVPKSSSGYVGILNPSCVCYLNSTLQQLFHVTSFRRGILETTTESSLGSAEAKNDMMLQLQFLFASLQESDQAFVDPKPFCFSFKDWDGRPTNVSIQQDASEFLAKFFQQVENAVMGSHSEGVLKDTFLGTISNELLATAADGTLRRSERPEPFYVLSVPVGRGTSDGNHCLTDALTSFISGEQVDYTWESEVDPEKNNNRIDIGSGVIQEPAKPAILKEHLPTTKRASIKQLPNHLIIHLKRFDFNFETMQQIKINDKFSYPEHLDMFPYTVLGRQEQDANMGSSDEVVCPSATSPGTVPYPTREECQYVLAGVVVHVGTAHSGHYYSLVKDRNSDTSTSWFELNDSFVSEFDIDDLESETFGGVDDSKVATQVGSAAAISAAKDKLRTKNAFLLVYDRVLPNNITEIKVESDVHGALVPASILESIQKENLSFWNTKSIFDPMYYGFLTEVVLSGAAKVFDSDIKDLSPGLMYPLLDFIVNVIFGTFAQAKSLTHVKTWSLWLVDRMRRRPALAYWLLQMLGCVGQCSYDKKNMLCALLLNCEEKEIRLCGKKIVSVAIVIVASDAQSCQPLKSLQQHENNSDDSDIGPVLSEGDSVCLQVVDHMMCNLLGDAQCKWRNIDVFFAPISVLAKNSATCCAVMQKRDYLATLLSFFLCQDSPYPELVSNVDPKNVKARAMCEGNQTADFSSLLGAVGAILLRSDQIKLRTNGENDIFSESTGNDKIESEGCSASTSGGDVTLPHSESYSMSSKSLNMMRSSIFFYRLLKVLGTSVTVPIVLKILQFVLKDSKELTEACTKIIISAMKKEDGIGLKAPIRCAMVLCQIKDSIQGWRVSYVMQQVVIEIKSNIQYVQATDTSITMFLRICKHAPASVEWFRLNYSARLTWLENYLLTRKGGILPQKSMLWKPIKTASGSNSKVVDKSPQGIAAATAAVKLQAELNLQLIKRVVNKGKVNNGDGYSKFFSVKFSSVGVASGGYDSDDDPADLVGMRIQVQWKSTFYPGEVASFDIQSNLHMVHFDDGEKVACNLRVKVWSLLID
jgi:ubiquitin C-terminal hydrolase